MRVLIIGAGALGIGIGASLKKGGVDVDFLARGLTKAAIDDGGISRKGRFKSIEIPAGEVGTYEIYARLPEKAYDYVIISTKTNANENVALMISQNRTCMKDGGKIVFMQNGYGYEEPFLQYFDKSELYHSRVITGFRKENANESVITVHQAPILIGSLFGYNEAEVTMLAEAINRSGLETQAVTSEEICKALWAKLIYNTTLNPLGAILNMSYGELADSDYAHSIMDILIEETFEIMNAAGGSTYWENAEAYRTALYEDMIPKTYNHRSSTLQDIEKKQKTEIDTLTGSLLNIASQYNLNVPVHTMIYALVKAMEDKF